METQPSVSWYVLFVSFVGIIKEYSPTTVLLKHTPLCCFLCCVAVSHGSLAELWLLQWGKVAGRGGFVLGAKWKHGLGYKNVAGKDLQADVSVFPWQSRTPRTVLSFVMQSHPVALMQWAGMGHLRDVVSAQGGLLRPLQGLWRTAWGVGDAERAYVGLSACLARETPNPGVVQWFLPSPSLSNGLGMAGREGWDRSLRTKALGSQFWWIFFMTFLKVSKPNGLFLVVWNVSLISIMQQD